MEAFDPIREQNLRIARRLLAEGAATPFLAISRDSLRNMVDLWNRHLPHVPAYYAVKANADPLVLRELFEAGLGADVASSYEMSLCASLGLTGDRMILSNPRKDRDTVMAISELRPWGVTVDSVEEIDKLSEAGLPRSDYQPVIFIRIKAPTKGVTQDLSSKFGLAVVALDTDPTTDIVPSPYLGEIRGLLDAARSVGFQRFGLAFHVGTQCVEPRVYSFAMTICRIAIERLRQKGYDISWVDIGGGFADSRLASAYPKHAEVDKTSQEAFLDEVGRAARELTESGLKLLAEPGRLMVADAGFLVTRVTYEQSSNIWRRIQIDDGIYRTLSARVHDERSYDLIPFRSVGQRSFSPTKANFAVWGCSCDSFDKVADVASLPADLTVGDYLMVECTGAYSTSFGSNTNGFQPAAALLYEEREGGLNWEVSPLADQNALLIAHVRRWAKRPLTVDS